MLYAARGSIVNSCVHEVIMYQKHCGVLLCERWSGNPTYLYEIGNCLSALHSRIHPALSHGSQDHAQVYHVMFSLHVVNMRSSTPLCSSVLLYCGGAVQNGEILAD